MKWMTIPITQPSISTLTLTDRQTDGHKAAE